MTNEVNASITIKLDLLIDPEEDDLSSATIYVQDIACCGGTREYVEGVLDDREVIVDVCDEGNVLLTHRLIQHEED